MHFSIWEAIVAHWAPNDDNRRRFWAFWAHHIQRVRYDAPPGTPYLHLSRLAAGKPHFVITTNVDAQFAKAGFPPDRLFNPQGDYGKFQCAAPCSDTLHDNRNLIHNLIIHMDDASVMVRDSDIPRCPACGDYLERNLRRDGHFVESPHMERQTAYAEFVNRSSIGRLVLLSWESVSTRLESSAGLLRKSPCVTPEPPFSESTWMTNSPRQN